MPDELTSQYSDIEAIVTRWVARRLSDTSHERRVAETSLRIFDLTAFRHGMSRADRQLLRLGALVHDVGRCVSDDEHPREGAWMILSETTLPFSAEQRRHLAYLTLYHRGPVPLPGEDDVLARYDAHARMRRLLGMLRASDALDSRVLQAPRLSFQLVPMLPRPTLAVNCELPELCEKSRKSLARRKKMKLLEETLDLRVEVQLYARRGLSVAA